MANWTRQLSLRTNAVICVGIFLLELFLSGSATRGDDFPIPPNTEKSPTSPMDPQKVVSTAKLPPGFELSLIAAEPLVQNPIAMTMDERGRLWVAENYSWSGHGFDPQVRDRIVILEDTDQDGRHDQRKVFWDEARKLTSLEVGRDGIWALCLPHLIFIPDANRDDIPDGDPQIVLDGFDAGIGNHNPANGLKWGPDGWLYGRQGILANDSIGIPGSSPSQRFQMNTGVWRYHPGRNVAEPVMHGMTNSWGFDFDQHGEMFVINTVIGHLWHVLPGAHTERMFGVDINPHSYKLLPQVADHVHWDTGEAWNDIRKGVTDKTSAAGGGHAHIGLMIYQGDNWPAEYRNRVYTLNMHGMRINCDILQRQGAGYAAKHGPDLCFLSDPWFRGMELLAGPDGGVFMADWSDTGECHDHDGVHRTSGRIYKLTYGTPKKLAPFDLTRHTNRELITLLSHPNTWWARQARRILSDRASGALDETNLENLRQDLKQTLAATTDKIARLRILETLAAVGGTPSRWWLGELQSEDEYERLAALKFLIDQEADGTPHPLFVKTLVQLSTSDPSGLIQLHLASAMQRLPVDSRWPIAEALSSRPEFAQDRMLPLMIWYGIEPAIRRDPPRAMLLIENSRMPELITLVSRRITVDIENDPQSVQRLLFLLENDHCPSPVNILEGMSQALNGWQKVPAPENWSKIAMRYEKSTDETVRQQVKNLSILFGDGRALDEVRKMVTDRKAPADQRRAALHSLLATHPVDYVETLLQLLDDRDMTGAALHGLAQYDSPIIPEQILKRVNRYTATEKAEMIQTLISRPSYAETLLRAVRNQKIPATDLSAFHARQIASFENEALTRELTELWGNVRISAAEKRTQIEDFKSRLTPELIQKADLSAGRALFQKTCASCHVLFGTGRRIGPDLTGSNRKNLDYLLENIIDPSASVGASFRSMVVVLEDGRLLNGVISEQNERTLTLQSAQETYTLDRQQIEEMKPTDVSLMPEGQLQKLAPEEVRDLIGYLMTSDQVPLPDEGKGGGEKGKGERE